ncbi:hypothetical protein K0O13_07975 [Mammaliicoccus sciuri]|uniref:hypothetical protein n=1 Tax=Mammaliicoccus sciuri TaxID=1296 RepID=UPI001C627E2E|nr:hypothetical protein [Mammaliicoccus sciuri]QYG30037.1 hypothetical protein K0O13_07975 [Mammaliicoccus sciuri]
MCDEIIEIQVTSEQYKVIGEAAKVLKLSMGEAIYKYTFKDLEMIVNGQRFENNE